MATAYAVLADLTSYGLQSTAPLGSVTPTQQQKAIDAANSLADGYLGARFKLPLTAWGIDLTEAVIAVARFKLLVVRGFNPEGKNAEAIVEAKNDALRWFENVSRGAVTPVVTDSRSGMIDYVEQGIADTSNPGAFVINKPATGRGW